ncbi:MAG: glycosyltransferase family 4 protein [Gammaproteobacteria bacterium]|nr:glycosyltransferase family 4 protein [Gammaproteobacteria bacterium]
MNILILCTSAGLGGLELYAEREWNILKQKGHKCFFVLGEGSKLSERIDGKNERNLILGKRNNRFPLISARKLANFIDKNNIDIVHMHWGKDLNLGSLAKRLSRNKPGLVYSRHMGITRSKRDWLHRFFYNQVDKVLVISKQVLKEAFTYLPLSKEKISLLYLGVPDPVQGIPMCDNTLGLPFMKHNFRIGMFGRIEHGKGQHLLLKAMDELVKDDCDMSAVIIGHVMDTEYFSKLQSTIKDSNLGDRIGFIDFIEQPMQVMPCFDVIVLLTYCETFGLVLVEAMRAGVTVIGTDAGGVPEIITNNETGMLIPPGDISALVDNLRMLYQDAELKNRLAQKGKSSADKMFNETEHFNQLNNVLMMV